jgi:hypothetical protein
MGTWVPALLNQMVITKCVVRINPRERLTDNQLVHLMGLVGADAQDMSYEHDDKIFNRTVKSLLRRGYLKDKLLPWRRDIRGPQKARYELKLTPRGKEFLAKKDPVRLLRKIHEFDGFALIKIYAFEYIIPLLPLDYLPEFLSSTRYFERKLAQKRYSQLT